MAKKRKTLPKDFQQMMEAGDLEALKAVYNQCELDAHTGPSRYNALYLHHVPEQLVRWLVEQGLDVNYRSTNHENTPLYEQVRYEDGCFETLIELGADVNLANDCRNTPLHRAARCGNVKAVKLLLAHGAKIDDTVFGGYTPLEEMLRSCQNIDIANTAQIAEILLHAGAENKEENKAHVKRIGETFEFYKSGFNKQYMEATVNGLNRLYELFDVPPVPPRIVHDGVSPITVTTTTWQKQHSELWALLVPGKGHAQTLQGEVIRITGKASHEILDNGRRNWDDDYRKMLQILQEILHSGNPLSEEELAEADKCVETVLKKRGETEIEKLSEMAVHWVLENPEPIKVDSVPYRR